MSGRLEIAGRSVRINGFEVERSEKRLVVKMNGKRYILYSED